MGHFIEIKKHHWFHYFLKRERSIRLFQLQTDFAYPMWSKIYAKIFASRLEKVIHSLIKEDQTGFIKGRNASDNMRRLLHILDFADSHPTPCAVFSLDAEKSLWQARVELYVGSSARFRLRWALRFYD